MGKTTVVITILAGRKLLSISEFNAEARRSYERMEEKYSPGEELAVEFATHRQWLLEKMQSIGIEILPDEDFERKKQQPQGRTPIFEETQAVSCLPAA